jgi:spermidine synthase
MLIKRKSIEAQANHKHGPGKSRGRTDEPEPPQGRLKMARKVKFAPVTLSEMDGVRYLHFGTEWVQGAMRLRKPDWLELDYAQQMMAWMLFIEHPQHIVQLGLGTGALTKFCYRHFPEAQITSVELNQAVIGICESMFKLPQNDERLSVLAMDAMDYVLDAENHGKLDVLQVDLYDATARGPVLDSVEFYMACADCLNNDGVMTVNLFGDHPSYTKNLKAMRHAFAEVICLPEVHDGNVIAIAFKHKKDLDAAMLHERAVTIKDETRLPTKPWVNGIKIWQSGVSGGQIPNKKT